MKRILVLIYCVVAYAIFFAILLYAFGFVNDLIVSKSMNSAGIWSSGKSKAGSNAVARAAKMGWMKSG